MKLKFVTNHLHLKRVFASLVTAGSTLVLLLTSLNQDYQNQDKVRRYEAQKAVVDEMVARYKAEAEVRTSAYTETYTTGFVSTDDEQTSIMYVETNYSNLNVRQEPDSDSEIIGTLENGSEITVIADSSDETAEYVKIAFEDGTAYIHSNFITEIKPQLVALASAPEVSESSSESNNNSTTTEYKTEYIQDSDLVLNSDLGRIDGPSGEETYYNLNMSKVVENAHNLGIEGEYNVREDGVKCLGDYVMVAANLDVHPRGSLVETSVGVGVVVDTGDFAKSNPTQIDVATTW